jgi:hypothetical protein
MSEYKDSPKPLRQSDPNTLFKEADDGYVVKGRTAIERQRDADGTGYSMTRPSSVEPKDYSLYIGEDKVNKSTKSVSAQMEEDVDPDEVIKSYMEKGAPTAPHLPPVGKSGNDDDEDTEKAVIPQEGKKPSSLPVSTGSKNLPNPKANNPPSGPYKPT